MDYLKIIFLAIIQGITEFLPVSSSGHLVIFEKLLNIDNNNILITTVLHAGTLLSILIVYKVKLIELIKNKEYNTIVNVIIGSIPVGILGLIFHFFGIGHKMFQNLYIPSCGLIITSIFLFSIKSKEKLTENNITLDAITFKSAFMIGCFQAFAILPGISRSGSTIASALRLRVNKNDAATFSFLLAIPVIFAASVVEIYSSLNNQSVEFVTVDWSLMGAGFIVSAFVGFLSLNILLRVIKKGNLKGYAYYCLCLGIFILIYKIFIYS